MPRDRRRHIADSEVIRALQTLRLQGLESGRYEPLSEREEFYQRLFRAGHRPDREDFILSRPLFQLEAMQRRAAAEEAGPFTPSPEPAISRG
jgi:hypothetical protein